MRPIFFAWTRSFWLAVFGIVTALGVAPPEVIDAISWLVSQTIPIDAATIAEATPRIITVLAFAGVVWQRSGSARPYTTDPTALE